MKLLKIGASILLLFVLAVCGIFLWAGSASKARMSVLYDAHTIDLPNPWPLSSAEVDALRAERQPASSKAPSADEGELSDDPASTPDALADVDLEAIALERALERGRHLVRSRFACIECHGDDFSGGVMIDDPAIGRILGPNLTAGEGGVVGGYTLADWDRKVRHGVNPGGWGGPMPSEDFWAMSDQELSDIVALIRSSPPVDNTVPPVSLGPVGKVLMALGKLPAAAESYASNTEHAPLPPAAEPTVEFGRHLAGVCTGCHRANFEGGLHPAAAPGWLPASNLTTGEGGVMGGYDFAAFDQVMRTGVKPNGEPVGVPMTLMPKYGAKMTDVEMKALFAYLKSLPPVPSGT